MKIKKVDIQELLKNDKGDIKMVYDALVEDNGVEYTIGTMSATYSKYYDIIEECERPQGIRPNQMQKPLLKFLIDNGHIK